MLGSPCLRLDGLREGGLGGGSWWRGEEVGDLLFETSIGLEEYCRTTEVEGHVSELPKTPKQGELGLEKSYCASA